MLSSQKLWFVALSLALMSCNLSGADEVKFCKPGRWPASAIQINLRNGDSRFDDLSGKLEKCDQAPVCISFPIVFQMGSVDRHNTFDISAWKEEILRSGRMSFEHNGGLWEYELSKNGAIRQIIVYEPRFNVRTKYVPCGGTLTLDQVISLYSKSTDTVPND